MSFYPHFDAYVSKSPDFFKFRVRELSPDDAQIELDSATMASTEEYNHGLSRKIRIHDGLLYSTG